MKNFIKYIFLIFIGLLFFNNINITPAVPTDSGRVCAAIENQSNSTLENGQTHKYTLLQKALYNCEISSVNQKDNIVISSDNKCALFPDSKLYLNYKHYYQKYISCNTQEISHILENSVIARAP